MAKTLVIFDVDGTLVYSNKVDSQCFADTYATIYARPFPSINWHVYPHVTDTTIFRTVIWQHFQRQATQEEIHIFQDHFVAEIEMKRSTHPNEFQEVPFARETVNRLLDDGRFVVGIGTGGWLRPAHVKLRHVGIAAHRLVMSAADGHETRDAIIQHAIQQARLLDDKITRIVYVGDALWDVKTTRQMGLNFIGIRREGDLEVLKMAGSTTVLQDFADYRLFEEAIFSASPPKVPVH